MITHKVNSRDYDRIFFASDFHLQHDRDFVWGVRGHADVTAHEYWIKKHLDSLTDSDLLIYCGDFALNTTPEFVQEVLSSIRARVLMVWGNHNAGVRQL